MKLNQFIFDHFRLNTSDQILWKKHQQVALPPKPSAVLQYLVRNAGRLVTKTELLAAAWPDVHVGDAVLKRCISQIREVLGDNAETPRFIETVHCRGYRFIAPLALGNVPVPLTTFIGRELEIEEIKRLVAEARLVTLHGPAGIGKTRLAIQIASDLRAEMPHGVWWVNLAPLVDPGAVTQAVASVVGVRDQTGVPLADVLAEAFHERRTLFVFDNCEHVVEECAWLAEKLLQGCPHLKIIATSRLPLRTTGETVWPVPTLSLADAAASPDALLGNEAVRLFLDRARVACPGFAISDRNVAAIAQICRRLDGLPIAIELAAARIRVLTPEEVAARLDDVFGLLAQGSRTELPRHQTLAAAFDWSYDLLSTKERLLFTRLSVFAGSFALAAVESVCEGDGLERSELLDLMARGIDHALVTVFPAEETRYYLLYTVREYARQKLQGARAAELARRHAEFFLSVAAENGPYIYGQGGEARLARLDREYDNLRAALVWARGDPAGHEIGLRIASNLWRYWSRHGRWRECVAWLEEMLDRALGAPAAVRAQALVGVGAMARGQKEFERARAALEEGVKLWRTTDNRGELGVALSKLGEVMGDLGDLTTAERLTEEAVTLLRQSGTPWDLAFALKNSGELARLRGRLDEAVALCQSSADLLRAIPSPWLASFPLGLLGTLAANQGSYEQAERYWRESLANLQPLEDDWHVSGAIEGMAQVFCVRGDAAQAARLFGAAEALRERVDNGAAELWPLGSSRFVDRLRLSLGDATLRGLWAEGRRLSRAEAIGLALAAARASSGAPENLDFVPF